MSPSEREVELRIPILHRSDVFVFASNESGEHSEGDAGWAFKGTWIADYQKNGFFREAVEKKVGKRARWKQSSGLQEGDDGFGWGIVAQKPLTLIDKKDIEAARLAEKDHFREQLQILARWIITQKGRLVVGPVGLEESAGGWGLYPLEEACSLWQEFLCGARQDGWRGSIHFASPAMAAAIYDVLPCTPIGNLRYAMDDGSPLGTSDYYVGEELLPRSIVGSSNLGLFYMSVLASGKRAKKGSRDSIVYAELQSIKKALSVGSVRLVGKTEQDGGLVDALMLVLPAITD